MEKLKNLIKNKQSLSSFYSHKWFLIGGASAGTALFFILGVYFWQPTFIPAEINKKVKKIIDQGILGREEISQPSNQAGGGSGGSGGGTNQQGQVDTSNWQTYTNEQFGYEVKYPESWKAIEKTNDFKQGIGSANKDTLSYQIIDPVYNDIEKARIIIETKTSYGPDEDIDRVLSGLVYSEKKDIEINNKKGILIKGSAVDFETEQVISNFTIVLLVQNNKVYVMQYTKFNDDKDDLQKEFEAIYNSFSVK